MKNLLIGFTGSVASILSEKICKAFASKYNVKAIVTEASKQFVDIEKLSSLKIEILSDADEFYPHIVYYTWDGHSSSKRPLPYEKNDQILHIALRDWADCLLIAPCSANTMAKIANGICDNLLTSVVRAWDFSREQNPPWGYKKKIILAPAMNCKMWSHPSTSKHLEQVAQWEIWVVDPVEKKLACGETGVGAMASIYDIDHVVARFLDKK